MTEAVQPREITTELGSRPSFTVVTPVFNMKDHLQQTIDSVLGNLRPGDQYFVVDCGSTDGTLDIIKAYAPKLTGWVSERDRGYADAIHKGFARATAELLCWINCGDLLLPGALDRAGAILNDRRVDFIFGDDFYIDEEGRVISYSRGYVNADLGAIMLFGGWTPLQDACFWRRALYQRIGGIDVSLAYAADYDLFLRMALQASVAYAPVAFSAFRRHPGQKSISGSNAYRRERTAVRRRELARLDRHAIVKKLTLLWYWIAIRWRIHVTQKSWRREDLHGKSIQDLECGVYWPPRA